MGSETSRYRDVPGTDVDDRCDSGTDVDGRCDSGTDVDAISNGKTVADGVGETSNVPVCERTEDALIASKEGKDGQQNNFLDDKAVVDSFENLVISEQEKKGLDPPDSDSGNSDCDGDLDSDGLHDSSDLDQEGYGPHRSYRRNDCQRHGKPYDRPVDFGALRNDEVLEKRNSISSEENEIIHFIQQQWLQPMDILDATDEDSSNSSTSGYIPSPGESQTTSTNSLYEGNIDGMLQPDMLGVFDSPPMPHMSITPQTIASVTTTTTTPAPAQAAATTSVPQEILKFDHQSPTCHVSHPTDDYVSSNALQTDLSCIPTVVEEVKNDPEHDYKHGARAKRQYTRKSKNNSGNTTSKTRVRKMETLKPKVSPITDLSKLAPNDMTPIKPEGGLGAVYALPQTSCATSGHSITSFAQPDSFALAVKSQSAQTQPTFYGFACQPSPYVQQHTMQAMHQASNQNQSHQVVNHIQTQSMHNQIRHQSGLHDCQYQQAVNQIQPQQFLLPPAMGQGVQPQGYVNQMQQHPGVTNVLRHQLNAAQGHPRPMSAASTYTIPSNMTMTSASVPQFANSLFKPTTAGSLGAPPTNCVPIFFQVVSSQVVQQSSNTRTLPFLLPKTQGM